jgi:alcohol dehydrogenase
MGVAAPYASCKPLAIEELELDLPGPGEVLVRIKAAGLCHSDLSVINSDRPRPLPMALGHEARYAARSCFYAVPNPICCPTLPPRR